MKSEKYNAKNMREEDRPEKHMGHGEFANMPRNEIFREYPKVKSSYGVIDDTIYGIDMVNTESSDKVKKNLSRQK